MRTGAIPAGATLWEEESPRQTRTSPCKTCRPAILASMQSFKFTEIATGGRVRWRCAAIVILFSTNAPSPDFTSGFGLDNVATSKKPTRKHAARLALMERHAKTPASSEQAICDLAN